MHTLPLAEFPKLESERLKLRSLRADDRVSVLALRSDLSVSQYVKRMPMRNLGEADDFIAHIQRGTDKGKQLFWVLTDREQEAFMGTICLWNVQAEESIAELGYELLPTYQRQGFMREALETVMSFGFDLLELDQVEAFTHEHNERSIHLLHSYGFSLQAERRDPDVPTNRIYTRSRN